MKRMAIATLLIAGVACSKEGSSNQKKLDQVLARLETIEKKLDSMPARPGAAQMPQRPRQDPNTVYAVPVDDDDVYRGAKHAKVTIIEAFDFACPYCAMTGPALDEVVKKHGDVVKVVSKQFVVHPQTALLPAQAACAAQKQGKGAEYEHELWARAWAMSPQPKMDADKLSQASLEKLAGDLKLNADKFKTDMASDVCKGAVQQDQKQLAAVGVNGTPALFLNGKPYQGARTAEALEAAINQEVAKADAAIQAGIKLEEYYSSLMKNAKRSL